MDARQILKMNPTIGMLDEQTVDQLDRLATVQRFRRGEALWRAGERATSVVLVGHGLVKVLLPGTSSRDMVLGLFGPGESVGDIQVLDGLAYPALDRRETQAGQRRHPQIKGLDGDAARLTPRAESLGLRRPRT